MGQHFQDAVLLEAVAVRSNFIFLLLGNVFGKAGYQLPLTVLQDRVCRYAEPLHFLVFGADPKLGGSAHGARKQALIAFVHQVPVILLHAGQEGRQLLIDELRAQLPDFKKRLVEVVELPSS